MTIDERLSRLERSSKRWRFATLALVGVVGIGVLGGAAGQSGDVFACDKVVAKTISLHGDNDTRRSVRLNGFGIDIGSEMGDGADWQKTELQPGFLSLRTHGLWTEIKSKGITLIDPGLADFGTLTIGSHDGRWALMLGAGEGHEDRAIYADDLLDVVDYCHMKMKEDDGWKQQRPDK